MYKLPKPLLLLFLPGIIAGCRAEKTVEGAWYGVRDRSLVNFTFNPDTTITVSCEGNSNLSFSTPYTLNDKANPMEIDLANVQGMKASGIARYTDDGNGLEVNMNVLLPGMSQRPTSFDTDHNSYSNIYFNLTRDKAALEDSLRYKGSIPSNNVLAFRRNQRLGSGINLNAVADGNLHPGYERDAPLGPGEIKSIADAGFESIRFDVCWNKHCDSIAPYTIDPAFLAKIDGIVQECFANGLAVSIDQHYYPYINMEGEHTAEQYAANFEKLHSLWQQLAEHYKDYPTDMLYFDLLNEPNMTLGVDEWNRQIASLVKEIHAVSPDRTILVLTPNLGQSWTVNCLELPEDDWNLIVQFHYYLPHFFSHQGLAYAQAAGTEGTQWHGTEAEKAPLLNDFNYLSRWSQEHGRPLNLGEYGAVNSADLASRARYLGFIAQLCDERGISRHLWGFRECFQPRDEKTGRFEPEIIKAINLRQKLAAWLPR